MKIQFLYFEGCPNHHKAFEFLQSVLKEQNIKASIERIEIKSDEDAVKNQFFGSPTIRVNGNDIEPIKGSRIYARTCRIYRIDGVFMGLPLRRMIEDALRATASQSQLKGGA